MPMFNAKQKGNEMEKFEVDMGRAAAIAAALGGVIVKAAEHEAGNFAPPAWASVKLDGGVMVHLSFNGWKNEGKVRASLDYPRDSKGGYSNYGAPNHAACISLSKSDEKIAGEIMRRVVEAGAESWAFVMKIVAGNNAYHAGKDAVKAALVAIGASCSNNGGDGVYLPDEGISIKYVSPGAVEASVSFELDEFVAFVLARRAKAAAKGKVAA